MNTKLKKKFEKYFGVLPDTGTMTKWGMYNAEKCWNWINQTLKSAVKEERKEIKEKIKGKKMPGTYNWSEENAVNKVLDDILKNLKK